MQQSFPKNLHVHTTSTKEEACELLTQALNTTLKKAFDDKTPFLLLVSGGSAFDLFPHIDVKNFSSASTVGVLDERFSTDPSVNNMEQFKKTNFYTALQDKKVESIDTTVAHGETMEQLAVRFDQELWNWKKNNSEGIIVATVGIGPDGHTSGVLPFPENPSLFTELFENPDTLVVSYDADGKNPYRYRATTTNTFLRNYLDHAFVYAVGANKKDALVKVGLDSGDLPATPARILREMKDVHLFTDVSLEENNSPQQ